MAVVNDIFALRPPSRAAIRLYHGRQRARSWAVCGALQARNRSTTSPVTGAANALVSLTSHGPRIRDCHLALESIAAGVVRPTRMVLWLPEIDRALVTAPLRRLASRGLEIRFVRDLGPHTKYFHALRELAFGQPLVTADDDILYPRRWLAGLLQARHGAPTTLWCYRARIVGRAGSGIAPYATWPLAGATAPSTDLFFTGVGGAAYPASLVEVLSGAGERFLQECPRADDVWVNHVARQHGIPVGLVGGVSQGQLPIARSQAVALTAGNVHGGGNDGALARLGYASDAPTEAT